MPVFRLHPDDLRFPPPRLAEPNGLLAVGGDLRPERLLEGYASGIFPWYSAGQPVLWHSPDPRFVLVPESLHVPKSLRKTLRHGTYEFRLDTAFPEVISRCAETLRPDQDGTWITDEMRDAYVRLHRMGYAHSAEAWTEGRLVGGLYGVGLGGIFFGESMFSLAPDASKVAFATLVPWLSSRGCALIDCQVHTEHLARFGAEQWARPRFLAALADALRRETLRGPWRV